MICLEPEIVTLTGDNRGLQRLLTVLKKPEIESFSYKQKPAQKYNPMTGHFPGAKEWTVPNSSSDPATSKQLSIRKRGNSSLAACVSNQYGYTLLD